MEASTQVLTKKIGPCGGVGGRVQDMNTNGVTHIVKISIYHCDFINALTITFLRNGREESTENWGIGISSDNFTEIILQTCEYIISIKGYLGMYSDSLRIRSLKFETNLQCFGPFGREEGHDPFELTAIRGKIIGFHGCSAATLHALGVYVQEPLVYAPKQSTNAANIPSLLVCPNLSRMALTHVLTKKIGPCGGVGGEMKDTNINGITHIVKISIHHSSRAIDALTVTFLRDGREESTELWGKQGGTFTEFHLQATEYITSVKGHVGIFSGDKLQIKSLKFETNLRTFGPYGKEEGYVPFELPAITGQIIGFHARAGEYLDAIGIYVQSTTLLAEAEYFKQLQELSCEYLMNLNELRVKLDLKHELQKELESKIESQDNGKELLQTKLKNIEVEHLIHSQELRAELDSKDDLRKKLESKIEFLENKNELLQTKFKHTEVEYLMHLQELRAKLDSKEYLQEKFESKIEYQVNKNEVLQTKLNHTEAKHLMHSQELRVLLDSKDNMQKKLESKIGYLENKIELLETRFKHTEVEYLMHSHELRAESDYKDDAQKKLESKIKDLENENVLMQTKEKDLKDAIKELLQSRESFVHHYLVDNRMTGASDGGNTGG